MTPAQRKAAEFLARRGRVVITDADTIRRVPNKPPMVMRAFRVPVKLWADAQAVAEKRQENISDVLRDALERYVKRG